MSCVQNVEITRAVDGQARQNSERRAGGWRTVANLRPALTPTRVQARDASQETQAQTHLNQL
jgi:hypothetical protein